MRDLGQLDHGLADRESRAGGNVVDAEVEVDVELVACERPALPVSGDDLGEARVHQGQLRVVGRRGAEMPAVADEPDLRVELPFVQDFALVLGRAPDDQLERAVVGGRRADVLQAGEQLLRRRVLHAEKPRCAEGWRSGTTPSQPAPEHGDERGRRDQLRVARAAAAGPCSRQASR